MKIFPLLALLLLCVSATAGVYKWTDEAGRVHYSDKPPETAAEKLDIETHRTDPEQLTARLNQDQSRSDTIVADQSEQQQLERERQIRRVENCDRSQKALASLLSATRVYEPLPDGERRYLEQDEIDQRKANAQADVDQWCKGGQ